MVTIDRASYEALVAAADANTVRIGRRELEDLRRRASVTGAPQTAGPVPAPVACPDEVRCTWRRQANETYRCAHGVMTAQHPRGYCDGGCCR